MLLPNNDSFFPFYLSPVIATALAHVLLIIFFQLEKEMLMQICTLIRFRLPAAAAAATFDDGLCLHLCFTDREDQAQTMTAAAASVGSFGKVEEV